MADEAKQRATQAKGEWKATTGETWGSDKADGWAVEVPGGPKVTQEEINDALTAADRAIVSPAAALMASASRDNPLPAHTGD